MAVVSKRSRTTPVNSRPTRPARQPICTAAPSRHSSGRCGANRKPFASSPTQRLGEERELTVNGSRRCVPRPAVRSARGQSSRARAGSGDAGARHHPRAGRRHRAHCPRARARHRDQQIDGAGAGGVRATDDPRVRRGLRVAARRWKRGQARRARGHGEYAAASVATVAQHEPSDRPPGSGIGQRQRQRIVRRVHLGGAAGTRRQG